MKLEGDAKFEGKLTCGVVNEMRNMANFHQSTWKSRKSRKSMSLKSSVELCVMRMKNDAEFEEQLSFHFKMRNLRNFDPSTWMSQKVSI